MMARDFLTTLKHSLTMRAPLVTLSLFGLLLSSCLQGNYKPTTLQNSPDVLAPTPQPETPTERSDDPHQNPTPVEEERPLQLPKGEDILSEYPSLPKTIVKTEQVLINHTYFQVSYNPKHLLANWVSHQVSADLLSQRVAKRKDKFFVDPLLSAEEIFSLDSRSYQNSGFDRGHLAPSADFTFDQKANDTTFVMSNMVPQSANLNQRAWAKLESRVRRWACGEKLISVVTGPVLEENLPKLKSGASIPKSFFKVIFDETPPQKAVAFIYHQEDSGDVYKERAVSVRALEEKVGFNFFPHLDHELSETQAQSIEETYDLRDWRERSCD